MGNTSYGKPSEADNKIMRNAATNGGEGECARLLVRGSALSKAKGGSECAALIDASSRGHLAVAKMLVDHGARMEARKKEETSSSRK